MSERFRWLLHTHVWVPVLLLAAIVYNRYWLKWRTPDAKQTFRLISAVPTMLAASDVWFKAAKLEPDPSSWAMMLGALLMFWLSGDTAWVIIMSLRPAVEPPAPEPRTEPRPESAPPT